jgi:hypothetical protein
MPSYPSHLLHRIAEVARVCAQARSAAERYERMQCLSDQALAEQGLQRSDLPRAALAMLDEEAVHEAPVSGREASPLCSMRVT